MALNFSPYDTRRYIAVEVRQRHVSWSSSHDAHMDGPLDLFSDHVTEGASRGRVRSGMSERIVDEDGVRRAPMWARHRHRPASFAIVWNRPAERGAAARRELR
jgi:hypothetical protein